MILRVLQSYLREEINGLGSKQDLLKASITQKHGSLPFISYNNRAKQKSNSKTAQILQLTVYFFHTLPTPQTNMTHYN